MVWHDNITADALNCACISINNFPNVGKFYVRADVVIGPYSF